MASRILLVASDVFVRRLAPSLSGLVGRDLEFGIVDIHRPVPQLRRLIRLHRPVALVTEWLPRKTEMLLKLRIPTVIAVTDIGYPGMVSIDVDDRLVGETAARFYVEAGYLNYGCISLEAPYARQRWEGFENFVKANGFPCLAFRQPPRDSLQYMESSFHQTRKLREWLLAAPKPLAVFAVHDPLGRLVCETALDAGLLVPDEVAVIGANDDPLVCDLRFPPLSSVSIPWEQIGALAGHWAQSLARKPQAAKRQILVPPGPVVVRQSTTVLAVNDSLLRRFLHYLREHFRQEITIDSACRELRISRRLLERKFHEHLRASPRKMLNRMRVEAAKGLLFAGNESMSEIAAACGFSRAERFSVAFRQQAGQTPTAYRKSRRAGFAPVRKLVR